MENLNKEIETVLAHEFWCCKRELITFNFNFLTSNINTSKEDKLISFTSYGNFLKHLYCFFEGIIEQRNSHLIADCKNNTEKAIRISSLLNEEVKKHIRNNRIRLEKTEIKADIQDIDFLMNVNFDENFGTHFRHIRNRFSHIKNQRVSTTEITLSEFFKRYHNYVLLLFKSSNFSWSIRSMENYNWLEIEKFMTEIKASSPR